MHTALTLLDRASDSWRNGDPAADGPLHWPVAVNLARRELRRALEAQAQPEPSVTEWPCIHCGGTGFQGDEPCKVCEASGYALDAEDARSGIA